MTATTHHGGGRPRLMPALGGTTFVKDPEVPFTVELREVALVLPITVIGSGPEADLRLPGLELRHAEIRHDERDELVLVNLTDPERTRVNGVELGEQALHTGDRIELDLWTFSYFRDESADHGRPYGGRQGGELSVQRPQPPRAADSSEGDR